MKTFANIVEGLLLAAAIFCLARFATLALTKKPTRVSVKLSPIVRLVKDNQTFCSGVVIRRDVILTALHCVAERDMFGMGSLNTEPIEIRGEDNKSLEVYGHAVVARAQTDQAVIVGNFGLFEPRKAVYSIAELVQLQQKGSKFIACGYPLGGDLFCQSVFFDSNRDFMWAVRGIILPGMSGGPVFSPNGSVIATNDAVEGDLSIIAPVWNVDSMLPKDKK